MITCGTQIVSGAPIFGGGGGDVPSTRTITAGTGLTGGGDLSADRTLAVSFGSTGTTACVGNDSPRIVGTPVMVDDSVSRETFVPEWVRRAQAGRLVAKDMTR